MEDDGQEAEDVSLGTLGSVWPVKKKMVVRQSLSYLTVQVTSFFI